jgi:hypothetical protein
MDPYGNKIRGLVKEEGASQCPPGQVLGHYGEPGVWQSEQPSCGYEVSVPAAGSPGTYQYAQDQRLKQYANVRGMDTHPAVRDAVRGKVDPSLHRGRPLWQ